MSKAESYRHGDEALLRPEVGTQPQFTKRKPPKTYRYDSSLAPALDWDGQNGARELGEWLIAQIEEASRLAPPHVFPEPRRRGDTEVTGLADAVARSWSRIGRGSARRSGSRSTCRRCRCSCTSACRRRRSSRR
jgi:hypothetical protein